MDIIIKDNGSSSYTIEDNDLQTLAGALVLDHNYKAATGHVVSLDFSNLPATDYSPADIQKQIAELDAERARLQALID